MTETTFEKYRAIRDTITSTIINAGYSRDDVHYLLTHIRPMVLELAKVPDCNAQFVAQADGEFVLSVEAANPLIKVRVLRSLHEHAEQECDYCYHPAPLEVYTFCNGHFGLIIC